MTKCNNCGWDGDVREIKSHEETDHEVWTVFTCPNCGEEMDRITEGKDFWKQSPSMV